MNSVVAQHRRYLQCLLVLVVLLNASSIISPLLNSNDAYFYALISKNIVLSNNWIELFYGGHDWLDKPHFPFWLSALSFKLFGINAYAYVLPGFLFHLIGAYYTYRLAQHLYNHECGLLAALIYLSSLHLLLSSIDVRAEAYLLGEIMAASYYWLLYDRCFAFKPLVLGSFFTALALMTKGPFVVVTIFSGLVFSWTYSGRWSRLINWRWLLAYALSLFLIVPELWCLYLQFDAHPEKLIFGQHGVSGISWFFWGSQFGRFFNHGPIVNHQGNPWFFIHTYLWAFLPWSLVFIGALFKVIRTWHQQNKPERARLIYLLASFWISFIMFSATQFQLDHYTNIIMPFAAILCARYLCTEANLAAIARVQAGLAQILLLMVSGLVIFFFYKSFYLCLVLLPLSLAICSWSIIYKSQIIAQSKILGYKCLVAPVLAISMVYLLVVLVNIKLYLPYNAGYNLAKRIAANPSVPVYSISTHGFINNLTFHSANPVLELTNPVEDIAALAQDGGARTMARSKAAPAAIMPVNAFLVLDLNSSVKIPNSARLVGSYSGIAMEKFIPSLLSKKNWQKNLYQVNLYAIR